MYERFYNLRERPFALSPDPSICFSAGFTARRWIPFDTESRAAPGSSWSLAKSARARRRSCKAVLQRLDDRTVIARVVNTMLEPRELLEAIALDFGLDDISKSKPVLVRDLGLFLVEQRRQGRRPLWSSTKRRT